MRRFLGGKLGNKKRARLLSWESSNDDDNEQGNAHASGNNDNDDEKGKSKSKLSLKTIFWQGLSKSKPGNDKISQNRISDNAALRARRSANAVAYKYAMHEFQQTIEPNRETDIGRVGYGKSFDEVRSVSNAGSHMGSINGGSVVSSASSVHSRQDIELQASEARRLQEQQSCDIDEDGTWVYEYSFDFPDPSYEESYGDSYIGAPLKYIYPKGFQSMRPGSGPWKLSIAIFVFFVWLSVFIVGHCSDISEAQNVEIDDENADQIEIRWCGSQLLYLAWFTSVIVTGMSCAYCSIIGYIKVRDFSVANNRSQPANMEGKSDYYVRVGGKDGDGQRSFASATGYQSDGNPQFWGQYIKHPNQAAIAVVSR